MVQVGTKFSSKPRNGHDHVYEIVGEELNFYITRNTSFPKYDTRGKERFQLKHLVEKRFNSGDYVKIN